MHGLPNRCSSYLAYDQTACCQGYFGGYNDKSSDSISLATSQFSEVFVSIDFSTASLKKKQKLLKSSIEQVGEDQCRYDVREMKSDSAPVDGCHSEELVVLMRLRKMKQSS